MTNPVFSLLHPTARVKPSDAFPRGWRDVCDAFFHACDHPERVEYVISVHESRWDAFWGAVEHPLSNRRVIVEELGKASRYASLDDIPGWGSVRVVKNIGRDCVVDQVNNAAMHSSGKVLMGVQDDCFPPGHWDTSILEAYCGPADRCEVCGWPLAVDKSQGCVPGNCAQRPAPVARKFFGASAFEREIVVYFSSGAPADRDRELMICGSMTRKRYERIGYGLDPDFESMFADNWFAFEARRDQQAGITELIERLDIKFEHRHPSVGKGASDDVYEIQNRSAAYRNGTIMFDRKVSGRKMILLCLPGETFRNEWVANTVNLIQRLGTRYITATQWCYTSNVYCTRIELAKAAIESPADYVLWIDDDNLVTAEQVQVLIDDLEANPQLGGVVGWCWCDHNEEDGKLAQTWTMSVGRQRWPDLGCLRFTPEDLKHAFVKSPLISADDVAPHAFWSGFPCVLMHRSTLEQLTPLAFAPMLRPEVKFGFVGEDVAFFVNAHIQGVKFAVDIRVKVPHVKWRAIEPGFSLEQPVLVESSAAD